MAIQDEERNRCKELIRALGLRATSSRIAVLELLRDLKTAKSHAEVAEALGEDIWDKATIYRNLVDMAEVGLLHRVELGDHTWRFEAVGASKHEEGHPHFVCSDCGTVECLPPLELRCKGRSKMPRSVRKQTVEVNLRGLCDSCD